MAARWFGSVAALLPNAVTGSTIYAAWQVQRSTTTAGLVNVALLVYAWTFFKTGL